MRRGGRGGEARTSMSPSTAIRLIIDSEARLGLLYTCRGGERAGLGSGAVQGGARRGGSAEDGK